jgi:hypothetical protein
MLKIAHRINTVRQLKEVPAEYGIELDIRYEGNELILQHDPFKTGEKFEDLLKEYHHSLIILNTKSEGMEEEILRLMEKYQVKNYFFLDLSLPYLIKYMKKGVSDIAVRFSEYEPLEFVLKFKDKVKWVWVDCFTDLPLNAENYNILKQHFKLCIVSPELQGYPVERIVEFKEKLKEMPVDAVCTKKPELW